MDIKLITLPASIQFNNDPPKVACLGAWTLNSIAGLEKDIAALAYGDVSSLIIDGRGITHMDTSGAWQIQKWIIRLESQNIKAVLQGFQSKQQALLQIVAKEGEQVTKLPCLVRESWLARVGRRTIDWSKQLLDFLSFTGELAMTALRVLQKPSRIRWRPVMSTIETTGFQALPIIALLSFMIGVVLTYQMGLQLRNYGANIFIVDLLGVGILREFGSLLTAIIVAGRTGSAFTAQLGTMKLNEEIDALHTMGVPPSVILILPKIVGLLIALPLLTIWSDIFGIFGGMFMSKIMLGISFDDFLGRFHQQNSYPLLLQ
jgi:phospholipid/cholesterol/gamma-HCH transport system permease protein